MRKGIVLLLTICAISSLMAQNDLMDARVFFRKGEVSEGRIRTNFQQKQLIRLYAGDHYEIYSPNKIAKIQARGETYYFERKFLSLSILKIIDSGATMLYRMDEKALVFRRKAEGLQGIRPRMWSRVLRALCPDELLVGNEVTNEDQFIQRFKDCNKLTGPDIDLPYDSILKSSRWILARLSLIRPEIGIELRILKNISFYNSIGMNFNSFLFDDASRAFINYDASSELRWFFTYWTRRRLGKSVHDHTGFFMAPAYKYMIEMKTPDLEGPGFVLGWQDNQLLGRGYGGYRFGIFQELSSGVRVIFSGFNMGWRF